MKTKICSRCRKEKPATAEFFHRCRTNKDGWQYRCKECFAQWYQDNRERVYRNTRAWRKANPEKTREYCRRWRKKNPDYAHNWAVANAEHLAAQERARYWENPAQGRAHNAVMRAVRKGKIPRASERQCSLCGDPGQDYHHPD